MCYIRNDSSDRRVIDGLTDGQECRITEDVLPLSVRLDTECEILLPSEVNLPLSGATMEKNDDGTRIAATWSVWSAWTTAIIEAIDGGY